MSRLNSLVTPNAVAASEFFAAAYPEHFAAGVAAAHKRAWKIGDDAAAVAALIFPGFIFADADPDADDTLTADAVRVAVFAACKRAAATAAADRKRAATEDSRYVAAVRSWHADATDADTLTRMEDLRDDALSVFVTSFGATAARVADAIADGHNDAETRRIVGMRTTGKGGMADKAKVAKVRADLRRAGKAAVWAAAGYPAKRVQTGGGTMIWGMGGGSDGSGLMDTDGTPFAGPVSVRFAG